MAKRLSQKQFLNIINDLTIPYRELSGQGIALDQYLDFEKYHLKGDFIFDVNVRIDSNGENIPFFSSSRSEVKPKLDNIAYSIPQFVKDVQFKSINLSFASDLCGQL